MKYVSLLSILIVLGAVMSLAPQVPTSQGKTISDAKITRSTSAGVRENTLELHSLGVKSALPGLSSVETITRGPILIEAGKYYILGGEYSSSSRSGDGSSSSLPSISYAPSYPIKFFLATASQLVEWYKQGRSERDVLASFIRTNKPSHVWDDKWYCYRLPSGDSLTLYAVRGEFDRDKRADWSRFAYTSATVMNERRWLACAQGKTDCYELSTNRPFKVKGFGGAVHFDFQNPPNERGFTGDDIMYSFGY